MIKVDNYIPMGDRVLIKLISEQQEQGGIIMVASSPLSKATVLKTGAGKVANDTGVVIPMTVKEGDTVLILNTDYPEIILNGESCRLVFEGDIQGII